MSPEVQDDLPKVPSTRYVHLTEAVLQYELVMEGVYSFIFLFVLHTFMVYLLVPAKRNRVNEFNGYRKKGLIQHSVYLTSIEV